LTIKNKRVEVEKMIKKTGYGSLSVLFFILAILSSIKVARTFCLGDVILKTFGIPVWTNGDHNGFHNSVYITIGFLIAGLVIGKVYKNDWGARNSWKLCAFFLIIFGLAILLFSQFIRTTNGI
jgi:hypothetical protein